MKHDVLELRSADLASRGSLWFKEKLVPAAKNSPLLTAAVLFSLLASIYWFFIASDRYVSEAHVIIQRTELTGGTPTDFAGILTGGSSINRGDQLILRDYLRSVDMVKKLDKELNLRAHYSDHQIDPFSRLASDATMEELRDYYLSRVSIEYDDYTGVLIIKSRSEEHTSELQSLMRISYAVFCLQKINITSQ